LSAWYLPKGAINAAESQLEAASSSCERWGMGCAGLVVVSLITELIIAWVQPPYNSFLTFSAAADVGVAIGIVGEVLLGMWNNHIQTELRKRLNEKLTDALERASRTEQELIHLKTPRRKLFNTDAKSIFVSALTPFSGTNFDIGMGPNDGEVEDFIWDIGLALTNAGWNQIDWLYPTGFVGGIRFGGSDAMHPAMAQAAAINTLVQLHPPISPALKSAGDALVKILNDLEIEAHIVEFNIHNANTRAVHILVGPKR